MTTNGERSFPCLVFYAARPPEATCVLQETLTSDYVFTNPATASKQEMTNDLQRSADVDRYAVVEPVFLEDVGAWRSNLAADGSQP